MIDDEDIRYEAFSGSGPGGQYRNRHANCVRAVHIPTGIAATGTSERSMRQNKAAAKQNLVAKVMAVWNGWRATQRKARRNAKPDPSFGHAIRVYRVCGKDQGVVDRRVDHQWNFNVQKLRKGDAVEIAAMIEAVAKVSVIE